MAGLISLTLPLTTLLGVTDHPGEAAGYGPLHADTAHLLACALAGHRATRWQVILTDPDGHALAAGTARGSPGTPGSGSGNGNGGGGGWTVQVTAEPIATGHCDHRNQEAGHDPSPALQRLVRARTGTCCGPGCRRSAARADLESGGPGESHPGAPTDPYVSLSAHTALVILITRRRGHTGSRPSGRTAGVLAGRCPVVSVRPSCVPAAACISAGASASGRR